MRRADRDCHGSTDLLEPDEESPATTADFTHHAHEPGQRAIDDGHAIGQLEVGHDFRLLITGVFAGAIYVDGIRIVTPTRELRDA